MSSEDSLETENSSNLFSKLIPILFGFILLMYMFSKPIKQLVSTLRLKMQTVLMVGYWSKVMEKHKEELDNFFQPLHNRKKEISENVDGLQRNLDILEIGVGDGANFAYYPDDCNVYALDSEDVFQVAVVNNLKKYPRLTFKKFYHSPAEDLSYIETDSIDAVVCTMCLCSVKDMEKVVSEVKRVLRKNGVFIFWEHVLASNNSRIKFFQYLLEDLWILIFGNCHLTRRTWEIVESNGFTVHKYSKVNIDTFPLISQTLIGSATK